MAILDDLDSRILIAALEGSEHDEPVYVHPILGGVNVSVGGQEFTDPRAAGRITTLEQLGLLAYSAELDGYELTEYGGNVARSKKAERATPAA